MFGHVGLLDILAFADLATLRTKMLEGQVM